MPRHSNSFLSLLVWISGVLRMQFKFLFANALIALAALFLRPAAADWPQFRGPAGSGVVSQAVLPDQWGPETNIKWSVEIPGTGWSQPIIVGNKIIVTTAITENQRKPSVGGFGGRGGFGGFGGPPGGRGGPGRGEENPPPANDGGFRRASEPRPEGKSSSEEGKRGNEQSNAEKVRPTEGAATQAQGQQPGGDQPQGERPGRGGFGGRGFGGGFGPGGFGGFGRGGSPPNAVYQWKVICLDLATGKALWEQLAHEGKPTIPTQPANTYASETPVSDGERVYAYFGMTGLYCFDLEGKLLWSRNLGSFPMMGGWGTASSPALDSERLFIQCDNEEKSFVVALDKRTGDELWRVERDEKTNWSTPYVWKNRLRAELVTCGNKVRSYDRATGKLLWEFGNLGGQCKATPIGDEELLYAGNGGRGMGGGVAGGFGGRGFGPPGGRGGFSRDQRGPAPGGDAAGGSRPANSPLVAIKAGAVGDISLAGNDTTNAGVAWSVERAGPPTASPLLYQGCVYILEQGSGLIGCYDATTGKQHYHQRIPDASSFTSSPWAADGRIYCLDQDGRTTVLQSGPELKVLGANKLNDVFWSSVAVAKGELLLRGVDRLYCIAKR